MKKLKAIVAASAKTLVARGLRRHAHRAVAGVQLHRWPMSGQRAQAREQSPRRRAASSAELEAIDASLLDIVDHVLTKGIVLTGDLVLGVADIDLVYLRLSAILCAADRVLGRGSRRRSGDPPRR